MHKKLKRTHVRTTKKYHSLVPLTKYCYKDKSPDERQSTKDLPLDKCLKTFYLDNRQKLCKIGMPNIGSKRY